MLETDFLPEVVEDTLGAESEIELGLDAVVVRLASAIANDWRLGLGWRC